MRVQRMVHEALKWVVPNGLYDLGVRAANKFSYHTDYFHRILHANVNFRNCHNGQRCFIVGTGNSLQKQDMSLLGNEIVFALNMLYLHKDYKKINPKYHVYSGLIYHPHLSLEAKLAMCREFEEKIGSEFFFTHYADLPFVEKHNIKIARNMAYIKYFDSLDLIFYRGVDLTHRTYQVANVALQALLIAIYMGFKEVYLLGLDLDWVIKFHHKRQTYFYKSEESIIHKNGFSEWNWGTTTDFEYVLTSSALIWNQYKKIKRFCDHEGIKIYNASPDSLLDVFPCVQYENLFSPITKP